MASSESRILDSLLGSASLEPVVMKAYDALPPQLAVDFVRAVYRELKNNPLAASLLSDICERASRSDSPLSAWISELVCAFRWLGERGSTAKVSDVLEYISCALEGSSRQSGHNVQWYLDNYGFERSVPAAR